MKEGYIKYNCLLHDKEIDIDDIVLLKINSVRSVLYSLELIGVMDNGIGYGNISIRYDNSGKTFYITGNGTGKYKFLSKKDIALVVNYDFASNTVECEGCVKASSESLSHAIFYEVNNTIGSVIHIHNNIIWDKMIEVYPTTSYNVEYGTVELAKEIEKMLLKYNEGVIVLGGHKGGLMFYGSDLDDAFNKTIYYYNKYI